MQGGPAGKEREMETAKINVGYNLGTIVIAGDPKAMVHLRNIVADAARYHKDAGRDATSDWYWEFWEALAASEVTNEK